MKKIISIVLISVLCLSFTSCKNKSNKKNNVNAKYKVVKIADMNSNIVTADSYEMDVDLNDKTKVLSGTVVIKITNNTTDIIKELHIRNYAATLSKSKVTDFKINNEILKYSEDKNDSTIITVYLNKDLMPEETVTLTMSFNSTVPNKKDRFGYTEFDKHTIYNLTFCFPILSMYAGGEWYDHPYLDSSSEPNISAVSDYTVKVNTPSGYTVIATGNEETNGSTAKVIGKNLREFAMVISNGLTVKTETVMNTPINYYYFDYDGNKSYNNNLCDTARHSFELYNNYFGNYIFDELDVVQSFLNSAMEYPGMVMIGLPDMSKDKSKKLDNDIDPFTKGAGMTHVAHEIGHQWFYAAVGSDPYLQPWLDEGITEYCEDMLYHASLPDIDFGELPLEQMDGYIKQVAKDKFIINKTLFDYKEDPKSDYSLSVYEGGKMFLYELNKIMGEEKFKTAMRDYYETYKLKIANTNSFIDIIKKHDSSEKVISIINKYIAQ